MNMSRQDTEFAWPPSNAPATLQFNPVAPQLGNKEVSCQIVTQFSIFFDGTRNHAEEDEPSGSQSNIARLFGACLAEDRDGQFCLYIPGVGTPFPPIGEPVPHPLGARDGAYGDRRLRYAYLYIANRIAELSGYPVIVEETDQALARAIEDEAQVEVWTRKLSEIFASPKPAAPQIVGVTLDLFGFSRGATAARAFLNQLLEWTGTRASHMPPNLFGAPLRVRFVGLFDTVASVHIADSMPLPGDGHLKWAEPRLMVIPAFVEQCVHLVAAHEARNSFPLTTISASQQDAPRRLEIIYPGMHSDVGGGYGPRSQGKGTLAAGQVRQSEADMLSQIPLNDMYDRAHAAGVPLMGRSDLEQAGKASRFTVSPELQRAYDTYQRTLNASSSGAPLLTQIHMHYLHYLGWRKHVLQRDTLIAMPFMQRCRDGEPQDFVNLDQANVEFQAYIVPFMRPSDRAVIQAGKVLVVRDYLLRQYDCMKLYDRYWAGLPTPGEPLRALLEGYAHDSRAAFVLTDPQCERDYQTMHADLERLDAQHLESLRLHEAERAHKMQQYEEALDRHDNEVFVPGGWMQTKPPRPKPPLIRPVPEDPLNEADRKALETYRSGRKPIFSDAHPGSSMDGKEDALDLIARFSRREVRWSYLRRRQVFRAVKGMTDNPRGEVSDNSKMRRLTYADGLS